MNCESEYQALAELLQGVSHESMIGKIREFVEGNHHERGIGLGVGSWWLRNGDGGPSLREALGERHGLKSVRIGEERKSLERGFRGSRIQ